MKYINKEAELTIEKNKFRVYFNTKSFENNPFTPHFKTFIAFEYDMIFSTVFFIGLTNYINEAKIYDYTFFPIEPSPKYFLNYLDYYGVGKISATDTIIEYTNFLLYDPKGNGETLNIVLDEVAIFSDDVNWSIYGSRNWEMCIAGFKDNETKNLFLESFGENGNIFCSLSEYIKDLDDMLHFSEKGKDNYSKLLRNYSI